MGNTQYIFLDTEFTDLKDPHLISVGIVTEDASREIYLERSDYDKSLSTPFVKAAVEPHFQTVGMPLHEISRRLYHWLAMLPITNCTYKVICEHLIDWELLIDIVENLPPSIETEVEMLYASLETASVIHGMKTQNILETNIRARNAYKMGVDDYFYTTKLPAHHALNDARAMRHGWIVANQSFYAKTY